VRRSNGECPTVERTRIIGPNHVLMLKSPSTAGAERPSAFIQVVVDWLAELTQGVGN
jgi:hypothetical protein